MGIQIITKIKQYKTLAFVSIFVSLAILPFFLYLHGSLSPDGSFYMFIANSILYGSVLQKDYYNAGAYPAFYYLLALVFSIFGKSFYAARAVTFIFNALSAVIIFLIGKKLWNKETGMVASILFLIGISIPAYEGYYVLTEPFMVFFGLLGVLLFFKSERWIYLILSGILFGVSALSKYPGGLFLAAIFVFYLLKLWIPENRTKIYIKKSIKNLFLIACGFLVPILLGAFYFWSVGALDSFVYRTALFIISRYGRSFDIFSIVYQFLSYSIVWILSSVSISIIAYEFITKKSKDKELFTIIWLFAFLYTFTARQFGHYVVQILPPACLLASVALMKIYPILSFKSVKESLSKREHLKIFVIICIVALVMSSVAADAYGGYRLQKNRLIWFDEQLQTAEYIKSHTSPNEKILSFSYEPSIYFLSDRNPPTEFLFLGKSVVDEEREYHIIDQIKESNIRYITVCNYYSFIQNQTLIINNKSSMSQHIYEFIIDNYVKETSIGRFDVYRKKKRNETSLFIYANNLDMECEKK